VKPRASFFLFAPGGVPIYAHATLPLGLALASQFSWRPYTWLGLIAVILVHEAGHALLLHRYRLPVRLSRAKRRRTAASKSTRVVTSLDKYRRRR
jgi:hypothetical protein